MMMTSRIWLILCIAGTALPWAFFANWIGLNGVEIPAFIQSLYANSAAGGFSTDLLISLFMFWAWSYFDAKSQNIRLWWLVIPAGFSVGLSLSMPLYFYLRAKKAETMRGEL